ncbi:MAG: hypothetical protein K0R48_234 [Gammaproteobacteria bacterium]|jgi:hypothetical protein|nr:hypothetical protein [Gammaproteobacteria bacterium]
MHIDLIEELSLTNYTAVSILERMGIDASQKQVEILESLVLMISHPKKVNWETIRQCVGGDELVYLFLYIKNKDLIE